MQISSEASGSVMSVGCQNGGRGGFSMSEGQGRGTPYGHFIIFCQVEKGHRTIHHIVSTGKTQQSAL